MITVAALIIGIWITLDIADRHNEDRWEELENSLGAMERHGATAEEIDAAGPGMPTTWRELSIRQVLQPQGEYQKLLRCRIDPSEVSEQFFRVPLASIERMRPVDNQPPSWWPWERPADDTLSASQPLEPSIWQVPDWWQPATAGYALSYTQPFREGAQGVYLHYDPKTEWLHLWEWKRVGVRLPPSPFEYPW